MKLTKYTGKWEIRLEHDECLMPNQCFVYFVHYVVSISDCGLNFHFRTKVDRPLHEMPSEKTFFQDKFAKWRFL